MSDHDEGSGTADGYLFVAPALSPTKDADAMTIREIARITGSCLGLAALAMLSWSCQASQAQSSSSSSNVVVVNSSAQAIPVTAQGTANVNISNTSVPVAISGSVSTTNADKFPSKLVSLTLESDGNFHRIMMDGSDGGVFTIAQGQVMVVTDISWHGCGATAGDYAVLWLYPPGGGSAIQYVSSATAGANGCYGNSDHLANGLVYSKWPPSDSSTGFDALTMMGYLAQNQ